MFNALKYTQELEKAGFTREQAEISIRLLIDTMNENFATKADLKDLELNVSSRIQSLEFKVDAGFKDVDSRFKDVDSRFKALTGEMDSRFKALTGEMDSRFKDVDSCFRELEYRLTIKLGTLMTIAIGVTATLVKLLPSAGH